jgi:hypothetical protein
MRSEDRWDEPVLGLLDDLEMQAEGLHLAERAVEVNELSVAQYAEVELVGRLHASVGRLIRVATSDGLELRGRLTGTGADWLLLSDGLGGASFVQLSAIGVLGGLAPGSQPVDARPLTSRLSLRSALRGLAEDRRRCAVHLSGGRTMHGNLTRVGADFAELRQGETGETGETVTLPLATIAVVQSNAADRS